MKKLLIPFLLLATLGLFYGCSKDKDVQDLENEVMESESQDYLSDTSTAVATQPAVPAVKDSVKPAYAKTPETAPIEKNRVETSLPERQGIGAYTVQVAAGTNPKYAKYLAETYIKRGFDAFVTEAVVNGETFYRIRVGTYDSFSQAKTAGLDLKDRYSTDFWIDNNY
nr:SPOR domain-containing protein [candidate division Zixibacteria bacterium]